MLVNTTLIKKYIFTKIEVQQCKNDMFKFRSEICGDTIEEFWMIMSEAMTYFYERVRCIVICVTTFWHSFHFYSTYNSEKLFKQRSKVCSQWRKGYAYTTPLSCRSKTGLYQNVHPPSSDCSVGSASPLLISLICD